MIVCQQRIEPAKLPRYEQISKKQNMTGKRVRTITVCLAYHRTEHNMTVQHIDMCEMTSVGVS